MKPGAQHDGWVRLNLRPGSPTFQTTETLIFHAPFRRVHKAALESLGASSYKYRKPRRAEGILPFERPYLGECARLTRGAIKTFEVTSMHTLAVSQHAWNRNFAPSTRRLVRADQRSQRSARWHWARFRLYIHRRHTKITRAMTLL